MIKGKDIIVVGIQAWDIEIGSNCKNIAVEFAKHNRVLYVNPPMTRSVMRSQKDKLTIQKRIKIKNGEEKDLVEISTNLWNLYPKSLVESINSVPVHFLFKLLNKRNATIFADDILDAISRMNFKNFILFNDSSMFLGLHLKELLKPKVYAYYMRDYLVKVPYWQKHGERIEPQVVKNADVVLTNSEFFEDFCRNYNANSHNAVDYEQTIVFTDKSTSYVNIADYVELHISEKSDETTTKETLKWVHITISNAKRNFVGTYHKIKKKYLQLYLNELVYKLNRRYFGEKIFDRLVIANITCL